MRFIPYVITSVCLIQAVTSHAEAAVLVAGMNPSLSGGFYVENSPRVFDFEQLFTLSTAVHATSIDINAGSGISGSTLRMELFSGLGMEGTGTLLQGFDVTIPFDYGPVYPTLHIPMALDLDAGSYSLLLHKPDVAIYLIYENAATGKNTPFGSLGGTHWSTLIISPGNIVFSLQGDPIQVQETQAPEPAMFLPVALALIVLGLRKKRP